MEEYVTEIENEIRRIGKLILSEATLEELYTVAFLSNDVATVVGDGSDKVNRYHCLSNLSRLIAYEYEFEKKFPYEIISKYLNIMNSYLLSSRHIGDYRIDEVANICSSIGFILEDIGYYEANIDIILESIPDTYKLPFCIVESTGIPVGNNSRNRMRKEKRIALENEYLNIMRKEFIDIRNIIDPLSYFKKIHNTDLMELRITLIKTIDNADYSEEEIEAAIVSYIQLIEILERSNNYKIDSSNKFKDVVTVAMSLREIFSFLRKSSKRSYSRTTKTFSSKLTDSFIILYLLKAFIG